MANFKTTYKTSFGWKPIEKTSPYRPGDCLENHLDKDNPLWIVPKKVDSKSDSQANADDLATIKRMQKKRLWSVYQVDYCNDIVSKASEKQINPEESHAKTFENALLEYCENLYGSKEQQIEPPLSTSRRIYGYIRPGRMYVPLTTYQKKHGEVGYKILQNKDLKLN